MIMSTSKLRENIYKILDRVLETGLPVEIHRKGKVLKIILPKGQRKLANIKKHDVLNCDPEDVVHTDWSSEWNA